VNGEPVDPENDADQQQPTQDPIERVRIQPVPLIGIPELSNPVQSELSEYLFSFFRVAQPLAIRHELPSSPPQCEVIQEDKHQQQQIVEQRVLLTDYSTISVKSIPSYGDGLKQPIVTLNPAIVGSDGGTAESFKNS
jgi:hypothetical protein